MTKDERVFGPRDEISGEAWVYVSRKAAHAHPMGSMHWSYWLIAAWLLFLAVVKFRAGLEIGGWTLAFATGFLPAFIALLVVLRAPIARILMIVFGCLSVYIAVESERAFVGVADLAELLVLLVAVIWMWEGARPNLAYGYRYRSLKTGGARDE